MAQGIETPRLVGHAAPAARPEQNEGNTAPLRGELFFRSLFAATEVPDAVKNQTESAPVLEKSIGQGATLRTCKEVAKMRAEGETPEGEAHRDRIRHAIGALIEKAGFKLEGDSIMRSYGKKLPEFGYTYMATIGQSCVSVHTYPERGSVSVRVDVCSSEMGKIEREDGKDSIIVLFDSLNEFFGANRFRNSADEKDTTDTTLSEILIREESQL